MQLMTSSLPLLESLYFGFLLHQLRLLPSMECLEQESGIDQRPARRPSQ